MSDLLEKHKATAVEFFRAMEAVDGAAIASYLTPDFVLETTGTSVLSGMRTGAGVSRSIEFIGTVLPHGVRLRQLSITAEEDRVAYQADGFGTTVDGEPYNNQYVFFLTFRNGKIARLTEYMDTRLVDERLGARYKDWIAKHPTV